MSQNKRKEGPMAAFQCISKGALVAKELGTSSGKLEEKIGRKKADFIYLHTSP